MNPLNRSISVVIPTWNRSACLKQAIQSALSQTLAPVEILVCDDGSTDDSENVVHSFKDPRVIWLRGDRSGLPAVPRNRGIQNSRGEWLAFLDDDDVWLPEKLELQMDMIQRYSCLASCTDAFRVLSHSGRQGRLLSIENDILCFEDLLKVNSVICSSVLASAAVVKMVGCFSEDPYLRALEDYTLWLRMSTLTNFAVVALPLLDYQDTPLQSIRKNSIGWPEQQRAVLNNFCTWVEPRGGEYYTKATEILRVLNKNISLPYRVVVFGVSLLKNIINSLHRCCVRFKIGIDAPD